MNIRDFHPISTPGLNAWRVPMWVEDGEYTVCVAQNKIRVFGEESLPDCIKAATAMIHAFPIAECVDLYSFGWSDPRANLALAKALTPKGHSYVYAYPLDERLHEIGWRVNEHLYILILNAEQLESLNG